MSELNLLAPEATTLPTSLPNPVGQVPAAATLATGLERLMSAYPGNHTVPTAPAALVGDFGSAHCPFALPGFALQDLLNPPHIVHRSEGAITMRAFTSSGKYRVDWGNGNLSSLDWGSATIHHTDTLQGWKQIRFIHETGNPGAFTQLWPGHTAEAMLDARSLTNLLVIHAYNRKLMGVNVAGLKLLHHLKVDSNLLAAAEIDRILIDLDANGLTNGTLFYGANPGSSTSLRSAQAAVARTNLLAKGWTITT